MDAPSDARLPSTPPLVVDAWAQHPTTRFLANPMFATLRKWTKKDAMPSTGIPVKLTTALMDQATPKVDVSLISAWVGPQGTMISNDEVASFVAQAEGRLVGVGSVDISRPMHAVREARRCVKELGFKGIRVLPWLWSLPPTDRRFYPVFAACVELGVPFCTQIGHTGPLMPSEVGRPLYLDQVALDFPELVIVAGHIGYPWTEEAVAVATKHANVYIDTSAYTCKRYPAELVRFLKGRGKHKVLFGTNFPMITPHKALQHLDALQLEPHTKALFLGGNAARVFHLDLPASRL